MKGQIAVALVTLNRVDAEHYPRTICGVVYQKHQFSWTKSRKKIKLNEKQWKKAEEAATIAIMDRDYSFKATHFHNKTVNPKWKLKKVATIGGHIFYK
jgi:spore germination cell wall hydrolase CwlJ-like protein